MENIKNLLNRLRQMGVMLFIGFLLIIYIALGLVYWQQASQQRKLNEQIANLSLTLARSLPSVEKLRAEYEKTNRSLAPLTVKSALDVIVGIAEKNGIDITPDADKFSIPQASISQVKVGISSYQLLSFKNIKVRGDYDNVMAFISDLDSGKTRETIVLRKLDIQEEKVIIGGEEEVIIEGGDEIIIKGKEKVITEAIATLDVDIYTKPEE